MTAEGKITTARLEPGTVILVTPTPAGNYEPAARKTGAAEGTVGAPPKKVTQRGNRRATSQYEVLVLVDDNGRRTPFTITAVPTQTWWLAGSRKRTTKEQA